MLLFFQCFMLCMLLQSFHHWDKDVYAKTEQAMKILEVLRIYIDITRRDSDHHSQFEQS